MLSVSPDKANASSDLSMHDTSDILSKFWLAFLLTIKYSALNVCTDDLGIRVTVKQQHTGSCERTIDEEAVTFQKCGGL
jgi:hypothetical protein